MIKLDNRKSASPNIHHAKLSHDSFEKSPLTIINIFLNEKKLNHLNTSRKLPSLKRNNIVSNNEKHHSDKDFTHSISRSHNYRNCNIPSTINKSAGYEQHISKVKSLESMLYPKEMKFYRSNFVSHSKKASLLTKDKKISPRCDKSSNYIKVKKKYTTTIYKKVILQVLENANSRINNKLLINHRC